MMQIGPQRKAQGVTDFHAHAFAEIDVAGLGPLTHNQTAEPAAFAAVSIGCFMGEAQIFCTKKSSISLPLWSRYSLPSFNYRGSGWMEASSSRPAAR
ncbi:hypothetical protein [Castellaniella sp. GW247-6E4]|uniref:hypothetical protein n=1 Tax=Castellaniella sp. GW247-6E4 TaxID=3140380 RepID=UPI003315A6BC